MPAAKTRYIRNKRPNRVNITVWPRTPRQVRFPLDRKGARGDTMAVPAEVFEDANFQRNFRLNLIEEIPREEYMKLSERLEDEPQGRLKPPPVVEFGQGYGIQGNHTIAEIPDPVRRPFVIEQFDKDLMSPSLEFSSNEDEEKDMIEKLMTVTGATEEQARAMLEIQRSGESVS